MPLTDPPFTRVKGEPPFHLRSTTPEEMEQWHRMRATHEQLFKDCSVTSRCDIVLAPSGINANRNSNL